MKLQRKLLALFAITGLALSGSSALAGIRDTKEVSVFRYFDDSVTGSGSMGSARNSTDGKQYMSCAQAIYAEGGVAQCFAANSAGEAVACYTYEQRYIDLIATADSDSWVVFTSDPLGACISVAVQKSSSFAPKAH
jgi:hypothetical protein